MDYSILLAELRDIKNLSIRRQRGNKAFPLKSSRQALTPYAITAPAVFGGGFETFSNPNVY
jgi:hypothetical protein